jgi:hypothetical protein
VQSRISDVSFGLSPELGPHACRPTEQLRKLNELENALRYVTTEVGKGPWRRRSAQGLQVAIRQGCLRAVSCAVVIWLHCNVHE